MTTTYPDHAVNMVVPFTAHGGSDVFARALAAAAKDPLKQDVTVENIPGADGTDGNAAALMRAADGYTVLEGIAGSLILAPSIHNLPAVKWDAMEPVARIQGEEEFLFVRSDFSVKTLDEIVALAKTSPGAVRFTGSVVAGIDSFVFQFLQKTANFHGTYHPYSGGGPAHDAFAAGMEDVIIGGYSDNGDLVTSGKAIPIAVASESRSPINSMVPTLKEKGYDVVLMEWRGVMAPKGTPADRIKTLSDGFKAALEVQSWKDFITSTNAINLYLDPSAFRNFLSSEDARMNALITELGLKSTDGG